MVNTTFLMIIDIIIIAPVDLIIVFRQSDIKRSREFLPIVTIPISTLTGKKRIMTDVSDVYTLYFKI